ncbi:MAG: quinone-dependent dihydroorotate dehydrogenase [Bdellovibrionia bacterium]
MIWRVLRFFLFQLEAETAHRLTLGWIRWVKRVLGSSLLRTLSGVRWVEGGLCVSPSEGSSLCSVFGMPFASPLGLAAGFDKNAEILLALPDLGFGFVEVGTVTPRPQPGNPPPRLFRNANEQVLFNRMGFNGLGATCVAQNVARAREKLPETFRIGVNIGKNKETQAHEAKNDYLKAVRPFESWVDYVVINVSSPNTPGLRALQSVESLKPIVGEVAGFMGSWRKKVPLLLKLAPELEELELRELIVGLEPYGVEGWVLTNTLAGTYGASQQTLSGGYSGRILAEKAQASLKSARKFTQAPIISVGGIMTPQHAQDRLSLGAQLIQIYSGWVFNGPRFPRSILKQGRK